MADLNDWRDETLARVRTLIGEADPEVVEESKWVKASKATGTPTWSHAGGICTGETYQASVKLTFFKGAALNDPAKLFNSSLDGKARRASTFTRVTRSMRLRSRPSSARPSPSTRLA